MSTNDIRFIKEWSSSMIEFINELILVFNDENTIYWQDRINSIQILVSKNRRLFYIGLSLIVMSFILFCFELSS